jgi:hypothetical protein
MILRIRTGRCVRCAAAWNGRFFEQLVVLRLERSAFLLAGDGRIRAVGKHPEQFAVSRLQPGAFLPQCVDFLFQLRPREANRHLAEVVARKKRYSSL